VAIIVAAANTDKYFAFTSTFSPESSELANVLASSGLVISQIDLFMFFGVFRLRIALLQQNLGAIHLCEIESTNTSCAECYWH